MDAELKITSTVAANPQAAQKAGREDAEAYKKGAASAPAGKYGPGVIEGEGIQLPRKSAATKEVLEQRLRTQQQLTGYYGRLPGDPKRALDLLRNADPSQITALKSLDAQRQREQSKSFMAEESLKDRTQKILQGQMGLIPPKLKASGGGGGSGMAGLSALSVSGIPYISTVARAVIHPMGAAAAAAGISLLALAKAAHSTMQEFENARRLYARQLQSGGMPGGFVAMRGSLARVMGVGESEVYQYGRAVQYLSARLASATTIQTRVNRELTSTSWEFQILGENVRSVFSIMANEAAPALRLMAAGLNAVTTTVAEFFQSPIGQAVLKTAAYAGTMVATAIAPAATAVGGYIGTIGAYTGAAPAPPVEAWSKRLPTSQWERMGMVMGAGVGGNPAQQTARNTKHAADLLQKILHGMTRSGDRREMSLMPSA